MCTKFQPENPPPREGSSYISRKAPQNIIGIIATQFGSSARKYQLHQQ